MRHAIAPRSLNHESRRTRHRPTLLQRRTPHERRHIPPLHATHNLVVANPNRLRTQQQNILDSRMHPRNELESRRRTPNPNRRKTLHHLPRKQRNHLTSPRLSKTRQSPKRILHNHKPIPNSLRHQRARTNPHHLRLHHTTLPKRNRHRLHQPRRNHLHRRQNRNRQPRKLHLQLEQHNNGHLLHQNKLERQHKLHRRRQRHTHRIPRVPPIPNPIPRSRLLLHIRSRLRSPL